MTQSTLSIVPRISHTIALLIFLAAYVHSYTGNYCTKDKSLCFQLNPNGKAEIVVDKVSIIGSYVKTGDNFLVTAKTAANQASKDLIVKKVKKSLEWTLDESFDSDLVWRNCNQAAENSIRSNNSTFLGDGKLYGVHEVAKCAADAERKWNQQKPQAAAANKKYLKELKYNDDLLKVFVGGFDFLVFLVSEGLNFTLIGNTLHLPNMDCRSALALTKSGFKESAFNELDLNKQVCVNGVVYNKCGGKVYDSETWSCENNILLGKCGDKSYNGEKQFCSKNLIKDYGKFIDSRDGKTYKTVKIGEQTWIAENLNNDVSGSKCYKNDPANCAKYGRLYDWNAAMKACPQGWRLPSEADWAVLIKFVYPSCSDFSRCGGGPELKAAIGWDNSTSVNGTNAYGFSALPGGRYYDGGFRYGDGDYNNYGGYWWGGEYNASKAYYLYIDFYGEKVSMYDCGKEFLYSVRCVQGDPDPKDAPKQSSNDPKIPSNDAKSTSNDVKTSNFRDQSGSKEYKTVKIGDQTWMAKNLDIDAAGSQCYKNDPANCSKYGRLYNWETAIKICPAGWHLPSEVEWTKLTDFVSPSGFLKLSNAGTKLKTKNGWSSWNNKPVVRGTDDFGFSALPGGSCNSSGDCSSVGNTGFWWTSTEKNNKNAVRLNMDYSFENTNKSSENKSYVFSVRCLQD